MTPRGLKRFGPTWRQPARTEFDQEATIVFCCCGVDMEFTWPRGEEAVRCFGCGRRFDRPAHFPARTRLTWNRPRTTRWDWLKAHWRGAFLLVLGGMWLGALVAVAMMQLMH